MAHDLAVPLEMTGNVPHEALPRLLAECEVFVLPSLYEGLPKALLEAMATGIPVLTTKVQGSGPLIYHRATGWLCEDTSPESLRRGLEALLGDSRLRAQIGRSARRFVTEHFSMESVLAREVRAYQELGCV
jgi:glycosyltransferase involved in cell wall biosynthesis